MPDTLVKLLLDPGQRTSAPFFCSAYGRDPPYTSYRGIEGGIRTHNTRGLSAAPLPVGLPRHNFSWQHRDSNSDYAGFKPAASTNWATLPDGSRGRIRTYNFPHLEREPLPIGLRGQQSIFLGDFSLKFTA